MKPRNFPFGISQVIPLAALLGASLAPISSRAEVVYYGAYKEKDMEGPAKDAVDKVAEAHGKGGIAEGLRVLESVSAKFLATANAQQENDFFWWLANQSYGESGIADQQWALAVQRWIYRFGVDKGRKNLRSLTFEMYFDLCIIVGDYAQARQLLAEESLMLTLTEDGVSDVTLLPPKGVVEKRFPYFQRKVLPTVPFYGMNNELLALISEMDAIEGNWRRSLESATIPKTRGHSSISVFSKDKNIPNSALLADSSFKMWRRGVNATASCYAFLRLYGLCHEEMSLLLKAVPGGEGGKDQVAQARWRVALYGYRTGKVKAEDALPEIRKSIDFIRASKFYPSDADIEILLAIAEVDFSEGRREASMADLDKLLGRKDLHSGTSLSLLKQWCSQRIEMKLPEGVEDSLLEALEYARKRGIKSEEIDLYELYAKFLLSVDRLEEAVKIQSEHLRLLRSFDLFTRLPNALQISAQIHARAGRLAQAESALAEARAIFNSYTLPPDFRELQERNLKASLPGALPGKYADSPKLVDLQPRKVITSPLKGQRASSVFTLENLTLATQEGVLTVKGDGIRVDPSTEVGVYELMTGAADGAKSVEVPITLQAGRVGFVQLTEFPLDAAGRATLVWQPAPKDEEAVSWTIEARSGDDASSTAIVDAAEIGGNAFRFASVSHLVQKTEQASSVVDIRARASVPMRVELYDGDGHLVFIDNEGDGVLDGSNDALHQDANLNRSADLKCGEGSQSVRFNARIRPIKALPPGGATLTFDILRDGKWVAQVVDTVVP